MNCRLSVKCLLRDDENDLACLELELLYLLVIYCHVYSEHVHVLQAAAHHQFHCVGVRLIYLLYLNSHDCTRLSDDHINSCLYSNRSNLVSFASEVT